MTYRCRQGHSTTDPRRYVLPVYVPNGASPTVAVCRECGEEMYPEEDDPIAALTRNDVEEAITALRKTGTERWTRHGYLYPVGPEHRVADALAAHLEQREGNKPA